MSDYLTEEEQLARLKSWWKENGKYLVSGIILVIAVFFLQRWYGEYKEDENIIASDLYENFLNSNDEDRLNRYKELVVGASGSSYQVLSLLRFASDSVAEADYQMAKEHLLEAVGHSSATVLGDISRVRLAQVLIQLGDFDDAVGILQEVESSGFRSLVAELRGDIFLAQENYELANQAYTEALGSSSLNAARPVLQMKLVDTIKTLDDASITD